MPAAAATQPTSSVPQSPYDLIALERTRSGLRIIGLGLCAWSLARPGVDFLMPGDDRVGGSFGWALNTLAMLLLLVGFAALAPMPFGPLPKAVRSIFALFCVATLAACAAHFHSFRTGDVYSFEVRALFGLLDDGSRLVCIALPWILARYCHRRGLLGCSIAWLWIAVVVTVLGTADIVYAWNPVPNRWLPAIWIFVPLAVIEFFAAQKTASAVWLEALNRHAQLFTHANPAVTVESLRPADRH
ncbi:MAG TPA: hypothetical protein VM509_12075 [Planctomycetota bacterium]|nr:hypothetical protein [Planctomycetota bacterium]